MPTPKLSHARFSRFKPRPSTLKCRFVAVIFYIFAVGGPDIWYL